MYIPVRFDVLTSLNEGPTPIKKITCFWSFLIENTPKTKLLLQQFRVSVFLALSSPITLTVTSGLISVATSYG